jgi:hypothetical protein
MRIYLLLFVIAWLTVGCQVAAETQPTSTASMQAVSPRTEIPPPTLTPTFPASASEVEELVTDEFRDHAKPVDPWETGGPGEEPKPTLELTIPGAPRYVERLEPYAPFQHPPKLPDLPTRPEAQVQLPDLYTLPPYDLRLLRDDSTGRVIIRFSNAIANLGPGTLELRGRMDSSTGVVDVSQRIFTNALEDDVTYQENGVGQFHFHDEHEHWHWDGFSLYEVYSILPDGSLEELIFSSDKVGYCLRDDGRVEDLIENNPSEFPTQERRYQGCGPAIQGLSIGWADIYAHDTPGQWVDVTGLPEGEIYALLSTTDPYNLIHEVDKTNNTTTIYFRLHVTQVETIASAQFSNPQILNE